MLIWRQKCYNKNITKFRFYKQDGENMTQLSKYEAMIVKSGSKLTKQRKQILKIIVEHSDEHFSAETLYDLVRHVDSSIELRRFTEH